MSNVTSLIIGIVIIIGVGGLVFWQTRDVPTPTQNTETNIQISGEKTLAEVAMHADATSCWSVINGNVYDLTSWIPQHPGGPDKILQLCGADGSAKFNKQHGGSVPQEQTLAGFKIGVLSQ